MLYPRARVSNCLMRMATMLVGMVQLRYAMAAFVAVSLALRRRIMVIILGGRFYAYHSLDELLRLLVIVYFAGRIEGLMRHADLVHLSCWLIKYTVRGLCL